VWIGFPLLQLYSGFFSGFSEGFGSVQIAVILKEIEHIALAVAGMALELLVTVINTETVPMPAEGTLLHVRAVHLQARLLGNHLQDIEAFFYPLEFVGHSARNILSVLYDHVP
jgi:hypothetical protein